MWSDNDIDNAFQRLNPPDPEPTPFPLDAWLRLETELDKAVIERAVRRRLWKFFAAEVVVVALLVLGWLAWPTAGTHSIKNAPNSTIAANTTAATTANSNTKPSRRAVRNQSVTANLAAPAATLPHAEAAANLPAPTAPVEAAAEASVLKSASHSATELAATPTVKHTSSTAVNRFSALTGPMLGHRRQNLGEGWLAVQSIAASQEHLVAPVTASRRSIFIRHEHTATTAPSANAVTRQRLVGVSINAKNTNSHPAAGSLAAPTEAPAEAVVADAASLGQLRRESQSPLLSQPVAANAPSSDATETGAPAAAASASDAAIATLAPNVAQLPLASAATLPTPLATVAVVPVNLPVAVRQPRFYIGLVAAPDLTTVKFVDVEKPKLNIGVVLEYRLTNRLLVSTGLLRANKQYYARRQDYDWTDYPRAQTRNFSWVDGACTVLDVPLNLRYDAVVRPQARLFGSVGLSSFFMQRENYSYDYLEDGSYKTWNIPGLVNENRHLFSVLNLSFGYEHRLGTHWRLQAEPYAKLPLGGVGAGKVQLTSGGVFFGVKYGF